MTGETNDDRSQWQAIKYWLSIALMIAAVTLMLWVFILESIH